MTGIAIFTKRIGWGYFAIELLLIPAGFLMAITNPWLLIRKAVTSFVAAVIILIAPFLIFQLSCLSVKLKKFLVLGQLDHVERLMATISIDSSYILILLEFL